MKVNFKLIISFFMGCLITGVVSVYAVYLHSSKDISFIPKNENWKVENVEEALNTLYDKSYKNFSISLIHDTYSNSYEGSSHISLPSNGEYKYFKITNLEKTAVSNCTLAGWSSIQSKNINLDIDTEYMIFSDEDGYKFNYVFLNSTSSSNGSYSRCKALITFYNK